MNALVEMLAWIFNATAKTGGFCFFVFMIVYLVNFFQELDDEEEEEDDA